MYSLSDSDQPVSHTLVDRAAMYLPTALFECLSAQQWSNTFVILLKVEVGIL